MATQKKTSSKTTSVDVAEAKQKLVTAIEKQTHFLVTDEVKNHVRDFTVLYVRRNCPDIDRAQMSQMLDIVGSAIDDAFLKNIDKFVGKLDSSIEDCLDAADPLANTKKE